MTAYAFIMSEIVPLSVKWPHTCSYGYLLTVYTFIAIDAADVSIIFSTCVETEFRVLTLRSTALIRCLVFVNY